MSIENTFKEIKIKQLESEMFNKALKSFHEVMLDTGRATIFWNTFVQIRDEYLREIYKKNDKK